MTGPAAGGFRELSRDEAPAVAEAVGRALEAWADGGPGCAAAVPAGGGFVVWVDVADFSLVACAREPGKPYRLAVFADAGEAGRVADVVAAALRPAPGAVRELYFNVRHFAH